MELDHPHLAVARNLWATIADGDAEAVRALLCDNVVWRSVGLNPLSGTYEGPDELLDYLARVGESVDELTSRMSDVMVSEAGAIICYRVTARRPSKELEMDYLLRLGIRDGRIAECLLVPVDQRKNDDFWE
jgi:ketosteroid isomerase-like protein